MKKYNRPSIVCKEMEKNNIVCTSGLGFNSTAVDAQYADSKDRGLLNVLSTDNSSSDEEDW